MLSLSVDARHPATADPDFHDSVELLIERHGLEAAEDRLLAALSAVRYRKYLEARQ